MNAAFSGVKACVFDAYGTVFDFGSAAAACSDVLGDRVWPLTALWRDKQVGYSWLRTIQGRYIGFEQVTADGLDYALAALRIEEPGLRDRLLGLYARLSPFGEVPAVLAALRRAGFRLAILSNGSPAMLAPLMDQDGVRGMMEAVISVDEVGAFKTSPLVYARALERLGLAREEVCFFSSNGWDAWAASDFGMRVMWCNRAGAPRERLPGRPDAEITNLSEALALLGVG